MRVTQGHDIGELRITEMTGPDAGEPPYPSCLINHAPSQRVINFDMNWAGINFGEQSPAPAVHITITGPDGTPLVAEILQAGSTNDCGTVRSFLLSATGEGEQLVYAMTLRQPSDAKLTDLFVSVDGHVKAIQLSPACDQGDCFSASPPPPWTSGTPYSISLSI